METILYHSNILSKTDVPFINSLTTSLELKGVKLILTGWNIVLCDWNLKPDYFQLPYKLNHFKNIYSKSKIELDFKKYDIDSQELLERFDYWFPLVRNEKEEYSRLSFLHFHLHHYQKLLIEHKPKLVIVWNGNDPRHVILSKLATRFQIEKLYVERGPLPSVIFCDREGVLNKSSVTSIDISQIKSSVQDSIFFDDYKAWYNKSSETLWKQPETIGYSNLREYLAIDESKKIILFVGQVDSDIQSKLFSPYFKTNLEAFDWFLKNNTFENHFVIGKHHPKSNIPIETYQSLLENKTNAIWTNSFALDKCLEVADYVVAVNSSVIFDALLYGKPVLTLGLSLISDKNIAYEYNGINSETIMNLFKTKDGIEIRQKNYNIFLEYLFREHIYFTKKADENERLATRLVKLKKDFVINDSCFSEYNQFIEKYYDNILVSPKKNYLVKIIKKKIKTSIKRILLKGLSKK